MECEKIKKLIPKYFQHTVSEEEIQLVEEHLCICHDCRTVLGELMDKVEGTSSQAPEKAEEPLSEEKPEEKVEEKKEASAASSGQGKDMEYFPGGDIKSSLDKIDEILEVDEPVKQEAGEEPEEKPEDKEPSFEILTESSSLNQEPPAESNTEAQKEEPLKEAEPSLREEAEEKEEPLLEPVPEEKQEASKLFLRKEPEEVQEEFTAAASQLNKEPIIRKQEGKGGFLGYLCLIVGLGVLGFLAYLLVKG